jgi:hypothetical protein
MSPKHASHRRKPKDQAAPAAAPAGPPAAPAGPPAAPAGQGTPPWPAAPPPASPPPPVPQGQRERQLHAAPPAQPGQQLHEAPTIPPGSQQAIGAPHQWQEMPSAQQRQSGPAQQWQDMPSAQQRQSGPAQQWPAEAAASSAPSVRQGQQGPAWDSAPTIPPGWQRPVGAPQQWQEMPSAQQRQSGPPQQWQEMPSAQQRPAGAPQQWQEMPSAQQRQTMPPPPAPPQQPPAPGPPTRSRQGLSAFGQEEIASLQEQWQRGEYQQTANLAVGRDGSLVLRGGAATLTARELVIRTWYGRRRVVSRADVARAALVQAILGSSAQTRPVPMLLVLDSQGRCLLHLQGVSIPEPDLKAFAAALGVPVEVTSKEITTADLRASYPGSVSWYASHPTLATLLIAMVIVVLVIITLIALAAAGVIKSTGSG